jgi:hypothetical protein
MITEKILVIVSSLKGFMPTMLKCLKNLGVTSFLPPPGGPIAVKNWISCSVILDVSFKSYLNQKFHNIIFLAIIKKNK